MSVLKQETAGQGKPVIRCARNDEFRARLNRSVLGKCRQRDFDRIEQACNGRFLHQEGEVRLETMQLLDCGSVRFSSTLNPAIRVSSQ